MDRTLRCHDVGQQELSVAAHDWGPANLPRIKRRTILNMSIMHTESTDSDGHRLVAAGFFVREEPDEDEEEEEDEDEDSGDEEDGDDDTTDDGYSE
jgi:hypothetical protein